MILIRTFYLSLVFISNCQPICPQPVLRKQVEAVLHTGFVNSSYWWHLKHPATLTRNDRTWNRDLEAECGQQIQPNPVSVKFEYQVHIQRQITSALLHQALGPIVTISMRDYATLYPNFHVFMQ